MAFLAAEKIYECREQVSSLLGVPDPGNVIFTLNTTYALNLLIKGILQRGDHVLISDLEHNSVFRPVYRLAQEGIVEYDTFPSLCLLPGRTAEDICKAIAVRIRPNTRLLVCTHASNICSATLPLREIGELCHKHGIFFAVDAAQSAGHIPIDMKEIGIDALCAPGHKGLCGIQGAGILALASRAPISTLVEGGNGMFSLEGTMPEELPERFEAGTPPTPAIAGLCEGIRFLRKQGIEAIAEHEHRLYTRLYDRLSDIKGIRLLPPHIPGAIFLFTRDGHTSENIARQLAEDGICVRGGHHCTALGHKTLGTPSDGAVRVSFGYSTTTSDLDALWRSLKNSES